MPPLNQEEKSSRPSSAVAGDAGGIRIAGVAIRAATSSSSAPTSSPRSAADSRKPPVKLDRERHATHDHGLPPKPAQSDNAAQVGVGEGEGAVKKSGGGFASRLGPPVQRPQQQLQHHSSSSSSSGGGQGRMNAGQQRPQPPQHRSSGSSSAAQPPSAAAAGGGGGGGEDDEEEEGAIDDNAQPTSAQQSAASGSSTSSKPLPPKTPPHPSSRPSSGAGNDRDRRRDHPQSYQPRSPSPPKSKPAPAPNAASSSAAAYYPRSPSPPHNRREFDNHAQESRRGRSGGGSENGNLSSQQRHSGLARGREDAAIEGGPRGGGWDDPTRGWDNDWRSLDRDRGWGDRDRGWHRGDQRDRHTHYERNGRERERERERSPPPARYAGWSPTPPHPKSSNQPTDAVGSNGSGAQQRPPSRMGRVDPPPPLSSEQSGGGGMKRPRSPSSAAAQVGGGRKSPPAGLLKRKANFSVVVPPTLLSPGKEPVESQDNVAPGAPIPPSASNSTMQSPVLPSRTASELPSQPGSALPTTATTAQQQGAHLAESNYHLLCQTLDDPDCPSVRLSCLPRKPSSYSSTSALSGRERRKLRPPPVPLNQRKFIGCSSLDDYEISIKLGQGTFGEVLKGRQILTGVQVALKKVTIHDAKDGLPITALREIKLLKKLKHPSIVPVIDMAYRPSGERGKLGDVYMVEPYMDHDLNGMLENPAIRLEHSQIKLYMKQLLEGTLYLHKNKVLHRDMKAANLLINNAGQLQIADFGLARPYRDPGKSWTGKGWPGGTNRYTNMVVTRWYRPPELLAGEKKYGPPIDMWGIGCILAEMIMGKPLFKGTSEINQLELIAELCGSPNETSFPGWSSLPGVKDADPTGRPDPHPEVPGQHDFGNHPRKVKEMFGRIYDAGPGCADLIDKLLVLDPKKRLTAQGALEHEWFWTKPWPADKSSLPKYEHSKEIDRVRRGDWKPAPAAAPAPVPAVQAQVSVGRPQQPGIGMGGGRPPVYNRAYANGGGGGGDGGWDVPMQQQRPGPVPKYAPPSQPRAYRMGANGNLPPAPGGSGAGGGRHPYPPLQQQQGGGRFAHQPPYPQQPQFHGRGGRMQHNLPPRPPPPSGPKGGNPYSF